jgi:DNA-binding transcriptional MerR regulator/effector-binding domain-containing protein
MSARLAIGDFARMTHLSVIALRHYHETGLLTPAEIDPQSGYRFYAPGQVQVAQVIRRFRDLGMPLDQIREVLRAPDVEARNRVIVAHMQRMEAQLALTQAVVASLRSLLERPLLPVTVEHRSVGPAAALAICEQVPAPDLDAWWETAFGELDTALATAGVRPAGPRAALYPAEFFQLGAGQVVAYVPVRGRIPATGRADMREIPAAELAVAVHKGTLADVDQTYGALGTYVAQREIGVDGPIREHYLVTQFDTDDESGLVTEVCWPVFQTVPSSGSGPSPAGRGRNAASQREAGRAR